MTGDFYKKSLADFGIKVSVPNEVHMQDIHQRIVDELCLGNFNDDNKAYFLNQINGYKIIALMRSFWAVLNSAIIKR